MDMEEIQRRAAEAQARLDELAEKPPSALKVRACVVCGAVVTVSDGEGGGVDNQDPHAEWHRVQEERIRALERR